jgi:hypothetical protein
MMESFRDVSRTPRPNEFGRRLAESFVKGGVGESFTGKTRGPTPGSTTRPARILYHRVALISIFYPNLALQVKRLVGSWL